MELRDRNALITGGSSGIGLAIAQRFLTEGARVAILSRHPEKASEHLAPEAMDKKRVFFCPCDVSKADEVDRAVSQALNSLNGLDLVVNCAGATLRKNIVDTTPEEWDHIIGINLRGVYLVCRAVIPHLPRGGCIINIGSVIGQKGLPLRPAYGAAKAGVIYLTKQLAIEYAASGLRVNCICPGGTETPLLIEAAKAKGLEPEKALAAAGKAHPLGRLGRPEEIAHAAVYLASSLSGFVTGTILNVDGGVTAG
jgi:NAD(P)-dependent dehydrogenase (short-subunit alcohol dehydrogenase family)